MNSSDINATLKDCRSLDSALTAVGSLGVDSGTIRVAGDDIRGWIVFSDRKIKQAVIADTAQVGHDALLRLIGIAGARCTYLPPDNSEGETAPAPAPATAAAKGEPTTPGKPLLNEEEFRAGVFGRDTQSEFENRDARLSDQDAPVRRNLHYRIDRQEEPDEVDKVLAKTGFASDFHDAAGPADPWADFHGDPANQPLAEAEQVVRRQSPVLKFAAAACLLCLCFSIYLVPKLMWESADRQTRADMDRRQSQSIARAMQDDVTVPVEKPFLMPAASNQPVTASAPAPAIASTDETPPDLSTDNADNIKRLIRWHLKHGNLKAARELAALGAHLPSCNGADRGLFVDLRDHYLTDNVARLEASDPHAVVQDYRIFVKSAAALQVMEKYIGKDKGVELASKSETNRLQAIQRAMARPH